MQSGRRILHPRGVFLLTLITGFVVIASCRPGSRDRDSGRSGGQGGEGGAGGGAGSGGMPEAGGTGGGTQETGGNGGGNAGTEATGGSEAGGADGGAGSDGTISGGGSGGAGGSGGGTAPDAAPDIVDTAPPPPTRGPKPAIPGHNFPFPQNRENSRCIYPNLYDNDDVQAIYDKWKRDTVTSDGASGFRRVKRPNEPGLEKDSTVSEGIAYGMMLAVFMDDQALFDDLWQYEQKWLHQTGLMHWYINAAGTGLGSNPSGEGPASDADLDMAFALVMADKQWGGQGRLGKKYIDYAKGQIQTVWANEFYDWKYLKPWPQDGPPPINLSYFSPAYHKIFARIDADNVNPTTKVNYWTESADAMYALLNTTLNSGSGNASNGLVPAWSDLSGKPNGGAFGGSGGPSPTNYQYDSCRTPFRIALDYCWFGDQRAKDYVAKTSGFFAGIGASNIVDGYELNGAPKAQYQTGANAWMQSSAFVGPAAVGAMSDPSYQTFVNESYAVLIKGDALVGGTYYDESWAALSLLVLTANLLDYTSL